MNSREGFSWRRRLKTGDLGLGHHLQRLDLGVADDLVVELGKVGIVAAVQADADAVADKVDGEGILEWRAAGARSPRADSLISRASPWSCGASLMLVTAYGESFQLTEPGDRAKSVLPWLFII